MKSALDPQTPTSPSLELNPTIQRNYLNLTNGNAALLGTGDGGWDPFNWTDGVAMFSYHDVAFLGVYDCKNVFFGHLGDRMHLRVFILCKHWDIGN